MVGSLHDWQKGRQFRILNDKKEERGVKVIRSGIERVIDVKELLVGDIALLEPGEIIPCDGVFISGHNVKCDESGASGESDAIKKVSYDDCIMLREQPKPEGSNVHTPDAHTDCFMASGAKVLEGYGKYVVIAVGEKSFNGRIMAGTFPGNSSFGLVLTPPVSQLSEGTPTLPHYRRKWTIWPSSPPRLVVSPV